MERFVTDISGAQRQIEKIDTTANTRIAKILADAKTEKDPLVALAQERFEGVFAYAESHRGELTKGGKTKTVTLPDGSLLEWRFTPFKITLRGAESIIKELKRRRLSRFIRTKEEVDKEAMHKERKVAEKVPGVTFSQQEEFALKPPNLAEIAGAINKLKKDTGLDQAAA